MNYVPHDTTNASIAQQYYHLIRNSKSEEFAENKTKYTDYKLLTP
jgi:hypothetical protein